MVFLRLGMMAFLANHPLSLGGLVLLLRLLVVGVVGVLYRAFLSVVLLLVFVGGLLVAFGYAVALASNPMFGLSGLAGEKSFRGVKLLFSRCFIILAFIRFFYLGFEGWGGVLGFDMGQARWAIQSSEGLRVGREWGGVLVFLGALLFFAIVAVVSMCSHYRGALIQFKREVSGEWVGSIL